MATDQYYGDYQPATPFSTEPKDTTDSSTGEDWHNVNSMFGVSDGDVSRYLEDDHGNDRREENDQGNDRRQENQFLHFMEQGDIEKIKKIQSNVKKDATYNVWRMQKTALQIAAEKGCFQMVHLLKDGARISVNDNGARISVNDKIYKSDDIADVTSRQLPKMVAKANPAYLCLVEEDPVKSALKWPSEFKKVFGPTNTLPILRKKYKSCKQQLTLFTEQLLNCCLTTTEVRTLLNGACDNGKTKDSMFLHDKLKLVSKAVRHQGKAFVAHRKTQLEIQKQWLDGQPVYFRWSGNSWRWFFFYHFFCFLFYGLLYPVLPIVYTVPRFRTLITSPKGKFSSELFSSIFFLVTLFDYEVLGYRHAFVLSFLLSWIIGSLVYELIQLTTVGRVLYFKDIWNILDLLVLISFAAGVLVRDYFIVSDSHFLLFLEKLPAVTLVCAMLRRMQTFYLSELIGKMFLIFVEMKTEVCRFLVIFGYVVLAFACAFYFLYYDANTGLLTPFLTFGTSLLHLTMTIFSETSDLEYMQLINHNVTVRGAQRNQRNGTYVLDASSIYDLAGFTLYTVFLTMAILVLLKLCIAMMTNKYRVLKESISMEWHFRRSEIWLLYIRQKIIFPPPFNVLEIFVRLLLQKAKCSANRCENSASDVEMSEVKGGQEKLMGEKEKVGSKDFKPTYKQLLTVLKVRYYKAYGCNNCKIHEPCVG